jgi:EpsG family
MWPYWLMFLLPAAAGLHNPRITPSQRATMRRFNLNIAWWVLIVVLMLLIGYRYQVGGDWGNYQRDLANTDFGSINQVFAQGDPGYDLLEWLSVQNGWGIFGVNFIGGLIFSFGLAVFCRNLPRPWLALAIAMPYLVIVVAMGYTRQGIAIGLAMVGLVELEHESILGFVFWVSLGAAFHKSAVMLLPIAALAATRRRVWTVVWVSVVVVVAYLLLLEKSTDTLYTSYVETEMQSQGALVRLLMNVVPALVLLRWRHRFEMNLPQMRLWWWMAILSLVLMAMYFITPASTALDRIALYMLPLQLAVFAYLPEVFGGGGRRNTGFVLTLLFYYAAVQFTWLNYAANAYAWLPYRFYPLVGMF